MFTFAAYILLRTGRVHLWSDQGPLWLKRAPSVPNGAPGVWIAFYGVAPKMPVRFQLNCFPLYNLVISVWEIDYLIFARIRLLNLRSSCPSCRLSSVAPV